METKDKISLGNNVIRLDFGKFFWKLLSFWWLFVICGALAYGAAYMYLRYATYEYSSRAVLLIKDAGRSGTTTTQKLLLSDYGLGGGKSMDNEIQILKSLSLMEKTVKALDLNINYIRIGNVMETELYNLSPFLVDTFALNPEALFGPSFFVELGDYETFLLKSSPEDEGVRYKFGEQIIKGSGTFTIVRNQKIAILKGLYKLQIRKPQNAAFYYSSRLRVERVGDQHMSSVLQLTITDQVPKRTSDILNKLIDIYNEEEVKDENRVLKNTLVFIDKRVRELVKELDAVEGNIRDYKSNNELMGEDVASSMDYTLSEIRTAVQKISDYEVQKNLLNSLEKFLVVNNSKFEPIPANISFESPMLMGLINQYNEKITAYNRLSQTATDKNPALIQLKDEVKAQQDLILETLRSIRRDLAVPTREIEKSLAELRSSMSSVPKIEKTLTEKKRIQAVKEQLFLYLLQKKEETALSEAVTTAKTRIIDRARQPNFAIYPKRKLIFAAALALGMVFPLLLVALLTVLDNKVDSEESIKNLTKIPILGKIPWQKGKAGLVARHGGRSAINEMFRLLRTNINFLNHGKEKQVLMVTSSVPGEGKTFIAANLGVTLSLADKKVVLLGMDLRRPKMKEIVGAGKDIGITNYLVNQKSLDEIIQQHPDHPNFSYIVCGAIPPNPAELILSEKMEKLIEELQKEYDYIVIDTPPIGLVSDALLMRKFVDSIMVVVHYKKTKRQMIRHLEDMYDKGELDKAHIVFNGVNKGRRYGSGGYYYGKKAGYYLEDE